MGSLIMASNLLYGSGDNVLKMDICIITIIPNQSNSDSG
jgi:hypothetical protein